MKWLKRMICAALVVVAMNAPATAQRKPVLPQIDLPHPYYYHEMYLPQLTSGPSSVAWSPDSHEVVYSMGGSLWRQRVDSATTRQLTDGMGYDYQPDWSPDGKTVVYVSYQKDAMELWLLDLASGKRSSITKGGAVNVEPRWSPDGKKLLWVSTQYNGRFHIFRADVKDGALENVVRLTGETKSSLPRYYYSAYDTEINPTWTRDGREILFVSNRGHIHGTGGFWRMKAEPGAEAREIHYEETNWRARPEFSPDGSRMVYGSYLGGQFHNLWMMPANGGDAFPLSYQGWDCVNPRWSPDGKQIAFISNEGGAPGTKIAFQDAFGGSGWALTIEKRNYLNPRGTIKLTVVDDKGEGTQARVAITDMSGRSWAPDGAFVRADDGFDRKESPFEEHYFHIQDPSEVARITVPVGEIRLRVSKGFAFKPSTTIVNIQPGDEKHVEIRLVPLNDAQSIWKNWVSSDLHVHRNYGGTYIESSGDLRAQGKAEGLSIVNNLVVNKEQRFPDIAAVGEGESAVGQGGAAIVAGQEFHTSYWGHRGILGLKGGLLLPGYAGYPNTAAASLYPMNADVYDKAHLQGALVGAVHPFDEAPEPFGKPAQRITDELPVDVALGKLDYMEIVGFSDHKSTAAVWYKLLNLGFKLPAGAGTDATTDYAAPIRGFAGQDRVYVWMPSWPVKVEAWKEGLKKGRTFATNGPLIEFTLGGKQVGEELKFDGARAAVPFTAMLRSIVPVDHLEIVCNGGVTQTLKLEGMRDSADVSGTFPLQNSGWCVLRAWSEKAEYPVMDNYTYATTSPIYVTIDGKRATSAEDAKYFVGWIDRMYEITLQYPDWNSAVEKKKVLDRIQEARAIFAKME